MASKEEGNLLKIGELARLADVLPSTVHYYTKEGLLKFSGETRGGYRLYDRARALKRLREIRKLQEKSRWTIREIKRKFRNN